MKGMDPFKIEGQHQNKKFVSENVSVNADLEIKKDIKKLQSKPVFPNNQEDKNQNQTINQNILNVNFDQ